MGVTSVEDVSPILDLQNLVEIGVNDTSASDLSVLEPGPDLLVVGGDELWEYWRLFANILPLSVSLYEQARRLFGSEDRERNEELHNSLFIGSWEMKIPVPGRTLSGRVMHI
jgi:hypothetical protein